MWENSMWVIKDMLGTAYRIWSDHLGVDPHTGTATGLLLVLIPFIAATQ